MSLEQRVTILEQATQQMLVMINTIRERYRVAEYRSMALQSVITQTIATLSQGGPENNNLRDCIIADIQSVADKYAVDPASNAEALEVYDKFIAEFQPALDSALERARQARISASKSRR